MTAGRPTDYTEELSAVICDRLAGGESLRSICSSDGMPDKATVFRWLARKDRGEFRDQYALAREAQADGWAEDIIDIADDSAGDIETDGEGKTRANHELVNRARLRVDTRKWLMARMAPKKYGDRIAHVGGGEGDEPIKVADMTDQEVARRLAFLLARGAQKEAT